MEYLDNLNNSGNSKIYQEVEQQDNQNNNNNFSTYPPIPQEQVVYPGYFRSPISKCHVISAAAFLLMAALGGIAITAGALSRFNIRPIANWTTKIAETLQVTKSPIEFGTIAAGISLVGFGIFSTSQIHHSRNKVITTEETTACTSLKNKISANKAKTTLAIACWATAAAALAIIAASLVPKTPVGVFFRNYPGVWIPSWALATASSLAAMALSSHILHSKPAPTSENNGYETV